MARLLKGMLLGTASLALFLGAMVAEAQQRWDFQGGGGFAPQDPVFDPPPAAAPPAAAPPAAAPPGPTELGPTERAAPAPSPRAPTEGMTSVGVYGFQACTLDQVPVAIIVEFGASEEDLAARPSTTLPEDDLMELRTNFGDAWRQTLGRHTARQVAERAPAFSEATVAMAAGVAAGYEARSGVTVAMRPLQLGAPPEQFDSDCG